MYAVRINSKDWTYDGIKGWVGFSIWSTGRKCQVHLAFYVFRLIYQFCHPQPYAHCGKNTPQSGKGSFSIVTNQCLCIYPGFLFVYFWRTFINLIYSQYSHSVHYHYPSVSSSFPPRPWLKFPSYSSPVSSGPNLCSQLLQNY